MQVADTLRDTVISIELHKIVSQEQNKITSRLIEVLKAAPDEPGSNSG